jgi:glycosyltransferase involved in cell wall biosynthesis
MFVYKMCFIVSLVVIFYVYVGYPICAWVLAHLVRRYIDKAAYEPTVTIIISAYNEEDHIGQTITNKLQLDYPVDKLEIIVISDESTDQTDAIIQRFKGNNVKYFLQKPRAGKTSAINMVVPQANGEILLFSDANSIYAPDALNHIVANFHDPQVGYVTGKMVYTNPDGTSCGDGCSAYMKYENILRNMETQIDSVVGVDGGIDAMRKSIYSKLNPDQLPDFVQPLKVKELGYRVVYEPKAILQESSLAASDDEYRMRVRVALRALWAIKDMRQLLWGSSGFLFAWQLWSHKLLRYLCFVFLLGAFITNIALWSESFLYKAVFLAQIVCYIGAFISVLLEKNNHKVRVLYFLHYFVLLNIASGHAFIKFILGKKQIVWVPRKG